jgi:hypothetical protein
MQITRRLPSWQANVNSIYYSTLRIRIVMKDECTLPDMGASPRPVALQAITRPEVPFVASLDVARGRDGSCTCQ